MDGQQHSGGKVDLVSAVRTPIGKFGGSLASTPATELGAVAIRAAVERAGLETATAPVDQVLMGQVLQAGSGQAPARQAALGSGLAASVPATAINRVCGSGLKAIMLAASQIRAGDADLVVVGGMESMNRRRGVLAPVPARLVGRPSRLPAPGRTRGSRRTGRATGTA